MPKAINPHDNQNKPIVDVNDSYLPTCYFNLVRLKRGETYNYRLADYESVIVAASGTCTIDAGGKVFENIGGRESIWAGDPSSVYIPLGCDAKITCVSENTELYIGGGKAYNQYEPFAIRPDQVQHIQYGSDETKTHRKIKHVLGQNPPGKVDRILVSELFTVGAGGWSGFPSHKHDTERPPVETRFEELYLFRFNPSQGFGAQFGTKEGEEVGDVFHIRDYSVYMIDEGYHPCVAAPGYEMYYFTLIVGDSQRSLIQYFHPDHAYQVETIPGIKDMIAGFK